MNNFIKDTLLLLVVLVISYFAAEYFGTVYDYFSPQSDDSWFSLTKQELIILVGAPFAYVFFTIIIFQLFGSGNRNKWTGWLLVPPALFFAAGDPKHIYLPIALSLIAWGLAFLIKKMFPRLN